MDIDDVLADYSRSFIQKSNELYGLQLHHDDYSDDWSQVWQVEGTDLLKRAEFFLSSSFMASLDVVEGARQAIVELSSSYDLVAVTARSRSSERVTREWLSRHFPGLLTEVHLAGFWDDQGGKVAREQTKAELCKELNIDCIIDDSLRHCLACLDVEIAAVWLSASASLVTPNADLGIATMWSEVPAVLHRVLHSQLDL